MKNIKLSFGLIFLMFFNPLKAQEDFDDEQSIYAAASLRYFLQQQVDDEFEPKIFFESEDVEQLWDEANHSEYNSLLQEAKFYYDHNRYEDAKNHLDIAWEQLSVKHPKFDSNSSISKKIRVKIAPFLMPSNHPIKAVLDKIFSTAHVTNNVDTLKEAGFKILRVKDSSFIVVAKHPEAKGYIFKIYPQSENRTRLGKPSWKWLVNRCVGATNIKKLIKKKKIKHFTVPDKWLYPLPPGSQNPVILVATDMHLVGLQKCKVAWLSVGCEQLDELYIILSHGCGSNYLTHNVPYTKEGKFAFIDTEYPKRKINLAKVKLFINPELHSYWDKLVKKGNKK